MGSVVLAMLLPRRLQAGRLPGARNVRPHQDTYASPAEPRRTRTPTAMCQITELLRPALGGSGGHGSDHRSHVLCQLSYLAKARTGLEPATPGSVNRRSPAHPNHPLFCCVSGRGTAHPGAPQARRRRDSGQHQRPLPESNRGRRLCRPLPQPLGQGAASWARVGT